MAGCGLQPSSVPSYRSFRTCECGAPTEIMLTLTSQGGGHPHPPTQGKLGWGTLLGNEPGLQILLNGRDQAGVVVFYVADLGSDFPGSHPFVGKGAELINGELMRLGGRDPALVI